jgi:chemotaxis protein histidine kinase CheA
MHLKHQHHIHSSASKNPNHNTMTTTTSTRLYEQACIAQSIAQKRFKTAKLSAPDELHSLNDNTNWDALSRKEFREIMIRMEAVTVQFYNDFGDLTTGRCTYPSRSSTIKAFWADEWGCEYLPESGLWIDLATNAVIKSETEKKADRDAKKALKALTKASKKEAKKHQYNDEEEEVYVQAAQKVKQPQTYRSRFDADEEAYEKAYAVAQSAQLLSAQSHSEKAQLEAQTQKVLEDQVKQQQAYDAWFDAEEEAYADAYAQARLQEEQQQQQQQQKAQKEAQAYLDSFNYTSGEEEEEQKEPVTSRICCQAVLYIEELTETKGDPDWRAYIYYDARIRRYVLKGTRRSLRATSKKTVFPEIKLCFSSSRELARYLCSSTDSLLNVSMFAMASATVRDATFAELYALPARGCKTELFGYDETRPRFSTFVNYLCMVRDIDATHSTFASF